MLGVVDGMGAEAGHIIATTIGSGQNGQPKQVLEKFLVAARCYCQLFAKCV